MRKALFIASGVVCVALGTAGIAIPGLPTTPFLLLASWLFYRSSPRLQQRMLRSRLGAYIRSYERRGGMTRREKSRALALMTVMVGCSTVLFISTLWVRLLVLGAGLVGVITVVWFVPSAGDE